MGKYDLVTYTPSWFAISLLTVNGQPQGSSCSAILVFFVLKLNLTRQSLKSSSKSLKSSSTSRLQVHPGYSLVALQTQVDNLWGWMKGHPQNFMEQPYVVFTNMLAYLQVLVNARELSLCGEEVEICKTVNKTKQVAHYTPPVYCRFPVPKAKLQETVNINISICFI